MEMQVIAGEGRSLLENKPVSKLGQEILIAFKKIEEAAMVTQSVNRGLRTKNHRFNEHLLRLLGEENLN